MKLRPKLVLQRVPELKVQLDSSGHMKVHAGERTVQCGSYGLAVLDAFSHPTPLGMAIEKIGAQVTGSNDWIDLTSTILDLYRAGILREEGVGTAELIVESSGYDSSPIHSAMLNDRGRTAAYIAGISEVVQPGDVVVDIGTGTGILAMAAARAGARRVYAIEASRIGKLAQANFDANRLADRITLVEGWSTRVTLPERADVLVSEMIGNEPLAENVIEVTTDACARLLKPNPRLVPSEVKIFGLPVNIPQNELGSQVFTDETLQDWSSWYGFDFTPMAETARNTYQVFTINPHKARTWSVISKPVLLAEIRFQTMKGTVIDSTAISTATAAGRMNGLLVYFELDLGPSARLSIHPRRAESDNHWRSPVWVLPQALDLEAGSQFSVSYKYRAGGGDQGVRVDRI